MSLTGESARVYEVLTSEKSHVLSKVNEAEELWKIDEEMDMLWKLGERGEISALIAYAMVLLRDDKSWYNPDEALSMLEPHILPLHRPGFLLRSGPALRHRLPQ